jgi:hypothetical protein
MEAPQMAPAQLSGVETPLDGLGDRIGSLHDFGAPYVGPLALHFANPHARSGHVGP